MSAVETIENAVRNLPPADLALFRRWFEAFDAAAWDRQIEADVLAGKLDALADEALTEHRDGTSREI
ncbi:hypothetical protein [Nevskia sp.]|uniref:hypothetical protein n=1 Tax=Nevskia sp. TaxID=1929292 RepID=UPI0025E67ECA|nr:hypothetical protein [Nevskia sp.]